MSENPRDPAHRSEFITHLRDEKIRAQQMRADYTMRKLAFVTTLFGLGSINFGMEAGTNLDLSLLLYLVPWVSIAFDLYIMGEDYGIKRIGMFLRGVSVDPVELEWENWVSKKRDWFAPLAMPVLTSLLLVGAALIMVWREHLDQGLVIWFVGTLLATWLLYVLYLRRRKSIDRSVLPLPPWKSRSIDVLNSQKIDLPSAWHGVREEVKAADYTLTRQVFERIREVFLQSYAAGKESPGTLTREYQKKEFLLVLDEHGHVARLPEETLARYRQTAAAYPLFAEWFKLEEGEQSTLLTARWLCHLVGLLHGTVEIFIDPPNMPGLTLVQVRGMDKFEAPGAFDIPCAGHISALESVEEALRKELAEELNLQLSNVTGVTLITRYNSISGSDDRWAINNEHRILYRAMLKDDAAAQIHFSDGEVAGLGVINTAELRLLVQRHPERVASGLSDAIKYYQ